MSRDTRLDELDAYLAEHSAAAHNVGQVELELSRAVNDYDKRTLRSERDEHLSTMHYVEHRIVALFAASLSVSPVRSERMIEEEREAAMKWVVGLMVLYGKENVREYTASEVQELVMNALASQPGRDSPAAPDRAQSVKPAHQEWEAVSPAPSDDAVWLSSIAAQHPAAVSPVPEPKFVRMTAPELRLRDFAEGRGRPISPEDADWLCDEIDRLRSISGDTPK